MSDQLPNAAPTVNEFDADTAVLDAGNGRWRASLSDRWNINDKPNGGYVMATAVRAMAAAVPDHPDPFSVTAHFLRPSQAGAAQIDVEIVRTGRKLATVAASFVQSGKERIRLLGSFGDLRAASGPSVVRGEPPTIAPLADCRPRVKDEGENHPLSNIAERTETLLDPRTGWVTGRPRGVAETLAWIRFADGRAPDVWSLPFFADALPPAVFEVLDGAIWVPTIELTVHVRAVPAPGWLRARVDTRFLMNGFLEEDCELWDESDTLVAQSRQLGMIFRE